MISRNSSLTPVLVFAAVAVAGGSAATADSLPTHAEAVASYDIRVRLDTDEKRLFGEERLVWRNPSSDTVGELWFHLYLNAFRNSRSSFYRQSGAQSRAVPVGDEAWGGIDVTSIRLADGTDLAQALSFEHPDDDNGDDRTVLRVRLPEPVSPGGQVTLDVGFEARVPGALVRTGYVGDYFLMGHWFPKLGVYEPAGRRGREEGGWSCHQFHPYSEFYADFGDYRVAITLPERFVVGATGQRVERRDNGDGTLTHVFEQADVHDFAWTADPRFLEIRRTFVAEDEVTPEEYQETARLLRRPLEELFLGDVEILLLLQPAHAPQAERHMAAAKAALKWYGLWYGAYPYDSLTIVDPPAGGGGSQGMEYPTFFAAGTVVLFNHWPLDKILQPEDMVVHEFGHQYWQGLVATNELEEPWLDEGFTTYSTAKVMVKAFGPHLIRVLGLELGVFEGLRLVHRADREFAPIRTPARDVSGDFWFDIYTRATLTLQTLERLLGEETMARVMRTYSERWRFRHPASEDFYAVAEDVSGRDLDGFFEETIEGPGFLDYAVTLVESTRDPGPRGILEDGAEATLSYPGSGDGEEDRSEDSEGQWRSVVRVRRLGEVVVPVDVELQFEGGPPERRHWDGKDRWMSFEVEGPHELVAAVVDPEDHLVLDVNRLNNARRARPEGGTAAYWGARVTFWLQSVLTLVGL